MSEVSPEAVDKLLSEIKELDAYRQLNARQDKQITDMKRELRELRQQRDAEHYNIITVVGIWQFGVLEQGDNHFHLDMLENDKTQFQSGDTLLVIGEYYELEHYDDPDEQCIKPFRITILARPSDNEDAPPILVQLVE